MRAQEEGKLLDGQTFLEKKDVVNCNIACSLMVRREKLHCGTENPINSKTIHPQNEDSRKSKSFQTGE